MTFMDADALGDLHQTLTLRMATVEAVGRGILAIDARLKAMANAPQQAQLCDLIEAGGRPGDALREEHDGDWTTSIVIMHAGLAFLELRRTGSENLEPYSDEARAAERIIRLVEELLDPDSGNPWADRLTTDRPDRPRDAVWFSISQ